MSRRSGFTFVELLMAMTVVGILSAVALPKFLDVKRRATATQILGDFDVLRHAVLSFHADSGYFPPETRSASIPRNLEPYLPSGFQMQKPQWTLDYENWRPTSRNRYARDGWAIGVSFSTPDRRLGSTVMSLATSTPGYRLGSKYTLLIAGF